MLLEMGAARLMRTHFPASELLYRPYECQLRDGVHYLLSILLLAGWHLTAAAALNTGSLVKRNDEFPARASDGGSGHWESTVAMSPSSKDFTSRAAPTLAHQISRGHAASYQCRGIILYAGLEL